MLTGGEEKGRVLDELCELTVRQVRKALVAAFAPRVVHPRAPRPPVYGPDVSAAQGLCWAVLARRPGNASPRFCAL